MKTKTYWFFTHYYDDVVRWIWYSLKDEVDMLDDFIQEYWDSKKKRKSILEVACGTWVVARELLDRWYNVFWIDISEDMLDKAEDIIGENRCMLQDMRDFDLGKTYDVVLCNYNSICHLIEWKDWQKFFLQAYEHLEKWWLLIFDITTVNEFETLVRDYAQFFTFKDKEKQTEDTVCLEIFKKELKSSWVHEKEYEKYYYERIVKMFVERENNTYDLIKETIPENSFEIEKIVKELEFFWFKLLHLEDFHKGEIDEDSERVYFIAKKM